MQRHEHPLRRVLLTAVCARPVGVPVTVFFSRRIAYICRYQIVQRNYLHQRYITLPARLLRIQPDRKHFVFGDSHDG